VAPPVSSLVVHCRCHLTLCLCRMSALARDSGTTVADQKVTKNKRKGSRGVRGEPAPAEARRVAEAGSAAAGPG